MTIHVTPIPSTIEFSDASPTTVTLAAQTAAAGSAILAQRGDHLHASEGFGDLFGPGSSTDNGIVRYSGTTGKLVQTYTSNAPTISDAGVIALTSGQLGFPATQIVSADANTFDDYEEGTFTPFLADNSGSDDEGQAYSYQIGHYTRIGNICSLFIVLTTSSIGTLTTSQYCRISGLPFVTMETGGFEQAGSVGQAMGLAITSGHAVVISFPENVSRMYPQVFDSTAGTSRMLVSEWSANGSCVIQATYEVKD